MSNSLTRLSCPPPAVSPRPRSHSSDHSCCKSPLYRILPSVSEAEFSPALVSSCVHLGRASWGEPRCHQRLLPSSEGAGTKFFKSILKPPLHLCWHWNRKFETTQHSVILSFVSLPPLPFLPLHFSTYVYVRCEMPAPADRYGSANHLHFRIHPLPSAGPSGDRVRCQPSAINTEMRPCVCCSAGKQVVTRPGENQFTAEPVFLTY